MRTITMVNGRGVALVDDADFDELSRYRWYSVKGYAVRRAVIDGKRAFPRMHRQLLSAEPGQLVDHINGNTLDNRRANLRTVTPSQNSMNRRKRKAGTSRYIGVIRQGERWHAYAKNRCIGRFRSEAEAALARDAWMREHFGQYARFNFPQDGELSAVA